MRFFSKILGTCVCFLIMSCVSYAQDLEYDECTLVTRFLNDKGEVNKNVLAPLTPSDDLYPVDATQLAIEHLQAACCAASQLQGKGYCPDTLPEEYPDQRMLFRHIIDIGMRRMDGYAEGIYGRDDLLDPLAKKWREYLTKQGTAKNGTPPQIILSKYDQMVGSVTKIAPYVTPLVMGGDADRTGCKNLQSYEFLGQRMGQQCAIAYCVTEDLYDRANMLGYHGNKHGLQLMYHECLDMQQQRIISEQEDTTAIVQAQATISMRRSQESYLQEYFVTRVRTLVDKVTQWVSGFEIVNTKYTEGTKTCS